MPDGEVSIDETPAGIIVPMYATRFSDADLAEAMALTATDSPMTEASPRLSLWIIRQFCAEHYRRLWCDEGVSIVGPFKPTIVLTEWSWSEIIKALQVINELQAGTRGAAGIRELMYYLAAILLVEIRRRR